jgi:hypothetical protein
MLRWPISRAFQSAVAIVVAVMAVAVLASRSPAIVPPTDCGAMTVKAKRYEIKADQLRCATAKAHARRYLAARSKPAGYRCRDYGSETKLKFRCSRGIKVFFAIRR